MVTRKISLVIFLLFLISCIAYGQGLTTAAMNGVIADKDGNSLAGATVVAQHVPSGTQFGTTTRLNGSWNLLNLRVGGPYALKVSFVGYKTQTIENIDLKLGQNLRVDFTLAEEAVQLSGVSVTAERNAILSTSRTGASTNIDLGQIKAFPTISRSFSDYAKFTPQVSGSGNSERGGYAAGRNNRYNNIQIDGTQYNDLFGLGTTGAPGGQAFTNPISLDAIQEFQVVIAPYDVRYGGFTGGGVNAITRAGTNNFSGSAYYFGRNQNFVGISPDALRAKLSKFTEYQTGFRIGGPILKDKMFFFLNGELTKRNSPTSQISLTQSSVKNAETLAIDFANILKNQYGYNPGSYSDMTLERPSGKLFARLDFNISDNHKLTLRDNYVNASDDITGLSITNLIFSSRNYKFKSTTNSAAAQLMSTFGNNMSNEFIVGYTTIRDKREIPGSPFPQIDVRQFSNLTLSAGTEQFSGANKLNQDIIEITDNFSYLWGNHVFTIGTHNEFFKFFNLFVRNYYGYYVFDNLDSLRNGHPTSYEHSYSPTGDPEPAAKFNAVQLGGYIQDEWRVSPNLKLTLGVRVDVPSFPDKPATNDSVAKYFGSLGYGTDIVPKSKLLFSPRVGFNYDVMGDRSTLLRGGVGIFTGRIPYVWISNQYGNTGILLNETTGDKTTPFITDVTKIPVAGSKGVSASKRAEINLSDPDLKMPQLLRFNLGFDKQLPFDFVGTVELLYSKSINDMIYQDANIGKATGNLYDGRPIYTKPVSSANFTRVMVIKNTSKGYQYSLSVQLQRQGFKDGVYANVGYTYGRAFDQNSVVSSQARSQYRFNPIDGDPNDPKLTRSNFEVRHRLFVALSYIAQFAENWNTTFSLFINGQSGRPFAYTYSGDINKDGHDGNDLIYIPKDKNDIYLGSIDKTTKAFVSASASNYDALDRYIGRDDYLKDHRGEIAERNSNVEPWFTEVDLRIAQNIPIFASHSFELTLDLLNVLNLLNPDQWGWVKTVNYTDNLITYVGDGKVNAGTPQEKTVQVFSFKDKPNPYQKDNILSRWQMQLGIRYSF